MPHGCTVRDVALASTLYMRRASVLSHHATLYLLSAVAKEIVLSVASKLLRYCNPCPLMGATHQHHKDLALSLLRLLRHKRG